MQDLWSVLTLFLLVVLIAIFFIRALVLHEYNTDRRSEELMDRNNAFTQTRNEPSAPLEEIYTIEIAPNMFTADTKPPPYSEIMANEMDLNEAPPSYLEAFKGFKLPRPHRGI